MQFALRVDFPQPVGTVFDFLAQPANRPLWQSSLRGVRSVTPGPAGPGTRWCDVTWVGLQPAMEITTWHEDRRWVELGRWRGVEVELALDFTPVATGSGQGSTRVTATVTAYAAGRRPPASWVLRTLGPPAVRHDLRRASRILSLPGR